MDAATVSHSPASQFKLALLCELCTKLQLKLGFMAMACLGVERRDKENLVDQVHW